ncbi:MAG TPA: transposase [Methanotrichaceae archaeon]|nr:transposase [Methanotrichaceae archaeon]
MEVSRTVTCRMKLTDEEFHQLYSTVIAFEKACNYISKVAFKKRCFGTRALHDLVYRDVRSIFKLPANLAVQAVERVAACYDGGPSSQGMHRFMDRSIYLDNRLFCLLRSRGFRASMSTVTGRIKPRLALGDYQRELLKNPIQGSRLFLVRDKFFLNISVSYEVDQKEMYEPVGVDLGIKKLLVASNGFVVKGGCINAKRRHFKILKDSLRAKGTSSARRRQKLLSGKEKRWMKTHLHQFSRAFVRSLAQGEYLVLERICGSGNKPKRSRKNSRPVFQSWAISRLQQMLLYKCADQGIPVVLVRPDFTSQRCPRCGTIDKNNRRTQALFRCISCGFQHNADFVASINLRELALGGWAVVSQPYVVPPEGPTSPLGLNIAEKSPADHIQDALQKELPRAWHELSLGLPGCISNLADWWARNARS